jgi:hypothetical protein
VVLILILSVDTAVVGWMNVDFGFIRLLQAVIEGYVTAGDKAK